MKPLFLLLLLTAFSAQSFAQEIGIPLRSEDHFGKVHSIQILQQTRWRDTAVINTYVKYWFDSCSVANGSQVFFDFDEKIPASMDIAEVDFSTLPNDTLFASATLKSLAFNNGFCSKESESIIFEENYVYCAYDHRGNWTKRAAFDLQGNIISVTSRHLNYYDGSRSITQEDKNIYFSEDEQAFFLIEQIAPFNEGLCLDSKKKISPTFIFRGEFKDGQPFSGFSYYRPKRGHIRGGYWYMNGRKISIQFYL